MALVALGNAQSTVVTNHPCLGETTSNECSPTVFGPGGYGVVRKGDEETNWKKRKQHTIEFIKTADINMKMLSCADKLANIKSKIEDYEKLRGKLWDKFNAPKQDQEWYYKSMLNSFNHKPSISHLDIYKEFKKLVNSFFDN